MLYENRKALREVCDKYEESHPEIKIDLTYRETEELRSNFQSSTIGGSGPELIYGPSDQVGPFAVMGIIKPLDDLFPPSFFNQFSSNAIVQFQDLAPRHLQYVLPVMPLLFESLVRHLQTQ